MSRKLFQAAFEEAERLRKESDTYLIPLPRPSELDAEQVKDLSSFLLEFNKNWKLFYSNEMKTILQQYDTVANHYSSLVVANKVVERDFWQRYLYRCNEA